jgi:hypothetical protein
MDTGGQMPSIVRKPRRTNCYGVGRFKDFAGAIVVGAYWIIRVDAGVRSISFIWIWRH